MRTAASVPDLNDGFSSSGGRNTRIGTNRQVDLSRRASAKVRQMVNTQVTARPLRNRSRLAAKKRPRSRPLLNFSIRDHQLSALLPSRSKMPESSARSRPCRRGTSGRCNRPAAGSFPARILPASLHGMNRAFDDPRSDRARAILPDRPKPSTRPRCLVRPLSNRSVRPCALTASTRSLIDVCGLFSGTFAIPAATGFRSM